MKTLSLFDNVTLFFVGSTTPFCGPALWGSKGRHPRFELRSIQGFSSGLPAVAYLQR